MSGYNEYSLDVGLQQLWTDAANNRTRVRLYVNVYAGSWYYIGYGTDAYIHIDTGAGNIEGQTNWTPWAIGRPTQTSLNGNYTTTTIWYGDYWFNHDANGYASYRVYGSFESWGTYGTPTLWDDTGWTTSGLPDYDRRPSAPGVPSLSRSASGTSITITSAVASSGSTITDYNYRWSTDNASWSSPVAMGTGRVATHSGLTNTQDYYYQTRAYGDGNWGDWSGSTGINGVPTVPTSVVGTASTSVSGRITVTWDEPSDTNGGITNYYVYRDDTYIGNTGGATRTYIDDGRTKGTNYSYKVVAYNAIGYSSTSSASTPTQAPGTPYGPTLNTVTSSTDVFGKVTLSWTPNATAVGTIQNYYVYADGVLQGTTTGAVASWDITGLNQRQTYAFTVRARNQFSIDNGTPGDVSNTVNKKAPGAPSAPLSLSSTAPYSPPGTINLTWSAPADTGADGATITGYAVYLAGSATPIKTLTTAVTSTTIEDLIPATSYTFNVKARNEIPNAGAPYSVASNSTTNTAQGEPEAPTGLTVVSDPIVAGRLILTWTPPVGYNTGFRVYTGADVLVANIAVPRLEIDGLVPNTSYSYKVRARNPLTDLTGSEGGPASVTVAGVVGASSTQTVPSISVTNTTNDTLDGTYNLIGTTATTMSYARTASNIPFASVPTSGGSTLNNTNTNLNGGNPYTISVVGTQATSTAITFPRAGADIPENTSTPSGTMYNNTNAIFNGNYEVLASPAPDPILKTISYTKVTSDITSRAASGPVTNNSNAVYNGEYVVSDVTETTISYAKANGNIEQSDAFGVVYNKTNTDIFNGTFTLTDTPDYRTVEYSTGDLTYAKNFLLNPGFEAVVAGTTVLRTNLITNPSFETNITGWAGTNASVARSSDQAKYGTHSALVSPSSNTGSVGFTLLVPAESIYTFSAWVYCSENKNLKITGGSTVAVPQDTWTRISHTTGTVYGALTFSIESVDSTAPFYVDGVLLESGSVLLPYFDGSSTDELGWNYEWSGTADASTSTAKALSVGGKPMPNMYASLTGLSSVTSSAEIKRSGTYSAKVVPNSIGGSIGGGLADALPAGTYTSSAWVYVESAATIRIGTSGWMDEIVDYMDYSVPATTWTRVSLTYTHGTGEYRAISIANVSSTATFYVDEVMIQEGTSVGDYFDGDTDANTTTWPVVYSWEGAPHNSVSIREVGGTLPAIGADLIMPYGQAARVNSKAQLQIQYRSGWIG